MLTEALWSLQERATSARKEREEGARLLQTRRQAQVAGEVVEAWRRVGKQEAGVRGRLVQRALRGWGALKARIRKAEVRLHSPSPTLTPHPDSDAHKGCCGVWWCGGWLLWRCRVSLTPPC